MTFENFRPDASRALGRGLSAFTALVCISLMGCLSESGTGNGAKSDQSGIIDDNLRAGASSSTNWPNEGNPVYEIHGRVDSALVLHFLDVGAPAKISGKVTFYQGGIIPALDSVPSFEWPFSGTDSIEVPLNMLQDSLEVQGGDTLSFSMKVDADGNECLLVGFIYSIHQKKFLRDHFSLFPESTHFLVKPEYSFRGDLDSLLPHLPPVTGNVQTSFYIPGTSYYWKKGLVSPLDIGPLPKGSYPLRLIRISDPESGSGSKVEIFEIKFVNDAVFNTGWIYFPRFYLMQTLWSGDRSPALQLRN
jgi:hypothetical protein